MNNHSIAIIDYGRGNLHSVYYGLKKIGADPIITNDEKPFLKHRGSSCQASAPLGTAWTILPRQALKMPFFASLKGDPFSWHLRGTPAPF